VEWNKTGRPYPKDRCIHELFQQQVESRPEAIALIDKDRQLSYAELNRRANQLAHYLRRLGVGPETPVGICMERSLETIVGVIGILKAGGGYLPLDPEYPADRLSYMLVDAGVKVVLTQIGLSDRLPENCSRKVCLDGEWERIKEESEGNPENGAETGVVGENLAYIIYTSGSTGGPKGVAVPHRAVLRLVLNTNYVKLDQTSCLLQLAPQTFDAATFEIWGALLHGGRLVMAEVRVPTTAELGTMVSQYGVETMWLTASLYNTIVDGGVRSLRGLKQLLIGGEALSVGHVRTGIEALEGTKLINGYGPTEGTTFTCCHEIRPEDLQDRKGNVPIGRAIANTKVYVMDERLGLAPVGVVGDLYIGGDGLAQCYFNRPEMTAEKFIPHPYGEAGGERLYRTGDLCRFLSNGNIEFIGRADGQVKIRGYRIELGEIESVLNEHRSVRQSVVIASLDERGSKRLVGYVVGEEGAASAELKRHVRERLPEYMVPESILVLEEMPVTANGKIDRKRLLALTDTRRPVEGGFVYPRDTLEFKLVQIWESILGIHPISVTDNFFDLGGHSLLAINMMSQIRNVIGRELPLSTLFHGRTIEALASILRRDASSMTWSCLVELQASGSQSPLFLVHPGGGNILGYSDLARCWGSDRPVYGIQTPGLHREQPLYTTIEDLAAHYVRAIRTVQPEGPYLLGGWSLGGVIAFEMAQQLVAQSQTVSHLLVFDTDIGKANGEEKMNVDDDAMDTEILMETIKGHLPISAEEIEQLHGDDRIDYVIKKATSLNFLPPDFDVELARHWLAVFRTNIKAMKQYIPQVYPGAVTLFKPAEEFAIPPTGEGTNSGQSTEGIQDPTLGWSEFAAGGARIIDASGEHTTMLSKPHVETLALQIKECLGDA
jgi:amino acid adenylation domain-containing protein